MNDLGYNLAWGPFSFQRIIKKKNLHAEQSEAFGVNAERQPA